MSVIYKGRTFFDLYIYILQNQALFNLTRNLNRGIYLRNNRETVALKAQ